MSEYDPPRVVKQRARTHRNDPGTDRGAQTALFWEERERADRIADAVREEVNVSLPSSDELTDHVADKVREAINDAFSAGQGSRGADDTTVRDALREAVRWGIAAELDEESIDTRAALGAIVGEALRVEFDPEDIEGTDGNGKGVVRTALREVTADGATAALRQEIGERDSAVCRALRAIVREEVSDLVTPLRGLIVEGARAAVKAELAAFKAERDASLTRALATLRDELIAAAVRL